MRLLVCVAVLFICLATLPSVHCQNRKLKQTEYSEKDRRDTKERYSKRDEDDQRYKKPKYSGRSGHDEEITEVRSKKNELRYQSDEDDEDQYNKPTRKYKREDVSDEVEREMRDNKQNKNTNRRSRVNARKLQESDEDEDTDEDNDSEICTKKKGQKCESTTEENEEEIPAKKRVTYVKKYAHEKKKTNQDREVGNILKLHKKSGLDLYNRRKSRDEDDFSEEVTVRRRGRFILADDDE